ncbi:ATS16 metalloproteinase, partial [Polypterus senegalus]
MGSSCFPAISPSHTPVWRKCRLCTRSRPGVPCRLPPSTSWCGGSAGLQGSSDMPKPPEEDIYILPDEYKYLSRTKRSVMFKSHRNKQLNVETLVVVDRKMMENHGNENITTYVLTILNMVSSLFKDGTIGGNINIVIVGLILLEDDQWCRRGQCVKHGDEGPRSVHGHWSDWSKWSTCSRTCGSGVTYRERQCNNPRPVYGGRFCEGSSRVYKLCNTQMCDPGSVDFRSKQCAEFNSKQFRGWHYNWKPYTQVEEQDACKLYCYAEGYDFFFALSSKVKDGTACSEESTNVCIDGTCEQVGCDRILGSSAVPDICGVCKGNNSTCKIYKGHYSKQHYNNQYYHVLTIPAGARSIRVFEMNSSSSYLSVRNLQQKYYLNGQWTIDWPGRHKFAGTIFEYKRPYHRPETLSSLGPINETLIIEILLQGRNPGIGWEYTLPKSEPDRKPIPKHNFTWAIVRSQCSVSCGGDDYKSSLLQGPPNASEHLVLQPQDTSQDRSGFLQHPDLSSKVL